MKFLWWRRAQQEHELQEELQSHLEMAKRDRVERGEAGEEAKRAARREFGNVGLVKEVTRDVWGWRWAEDFVEDVHFGLRMLRKNSGFAAVVVLTLALGIGATTAVFSLTNAVLIRSLPYRDADRLVYLYTPNPRFPQVPLDEFAPTNADFFDLKQQSQSYAQMSLFADNSYNLAAKGVAQRARGAAVDGSFFSTLGVPPEIGRGIDSEDDQPGHEHVAVISHELWRSVFAERPDILNKDTLLDGQRYLIIGVMPADFQYPRAGEFEVGGVDVPANVWIPLALTPQQKKDRDSGSGSIVARLRAGVTLPQAQAEITTIMARLDLLHDANLRGFQGYVKPFVDSAVGEVRPLFRLLLGAVMLVLLIACGNATNLLLARATTRSHELGIRSALGARRLRLVRQMLTEAVLLSCTAGVLGVLLAHAFVRVLLLLNPGNIPRLEETSIDARVLAFSLGVSILSGIAFGIFPAFSSSRTNVNELLQRGGNRGATGSGNRVRNALIVAQLAMSVVLLTGAGLLIRSYLKIEAVDTGFSPSTISMRITLDNRYQKREQTIGFFRQLLEKISAIPGVRSAGAVTNLPLSYTESMSTFMVEGYPNQKDQLTDTRLVTPGYFAAMGTRLVEGRFFEEFDVSGRPPVVIVNETFARNFFPGQNALGKHYSLRDFGQETAKEWSTVVGVVADVRHSTLEGSPKGQVYAPLWQADTNSAYIAVRTILPPEQIAQSIPKVVQDIDPLIAVADLHTMQDLISAAEGRRRFQTSLFAVFAGVALFLALTGLYGVMTYAVRQRSQEIGIRMALGAQRGDVLKLIMLRGILLTGCGLALGLAGAVVFARFVSSMLFGVVFADPATFGSVGILLVLTGMAACYLPARRAMKVDPMVALRYE
jgi:predicted permease